MSLDLESRGIEHVGQLGSDLAAVDDPRPVKELPALDSILRDEADFANRDYAPFADALDMSPSMFRKYELPIELWDWRQTASILLGDIKGTSFLDFGCGMGEESIYFAKLGARVTAIDVSEVGVETLKRRAVHNKLDIHAYEMRCDPTSFSDASFDRIHGMGILHHVGIEHALAEVKRLLRPGGVGVFLEPMGDSRTIEAAKELLMTRARFLGDFDEVTEHEHNLTWDEIAHATRRFSRTTTFPYHLLYRIKRFFPYSFHGALKRVDHSLLTVLPPLKHFAGAVVIKVVK